MPIHFTVQTSLLYLLLIPASFESLFIMNAFSKSFYGTCIKYWLRNTYILYYSVHRVFNFKRFDTLYCTCELTSSFERQDPPSHCSCWRIVIKCVHRPKTITLEFIFLSLSQIVSSSTVFFILSLPWHWFQISSHIKFYHFVPYMNMNLWIFLHVHFKKFLSEHWKGMWAFIILLIFTMFSKHSVLTYQCLVNDLYFSIFF